MTIEALESTSSSSTGHRTRNRAMPRINLPPDTDWTLPTAVLAAHHGASVRTIRNRRNEFGIPPLTGRFSKSGVERINRSIKIEAALDRAVRRVAKAQSISWSNALERLAKLGLQALKKPDPHAKGSNPQAEPV